MKQEGGFRAPFRDSSTLKTVSLISLRLCYWFEFKRG